MKSISTKLFSYILAIATLVLSAPLANAQRGEKSIGIQAGYSSGNESVATGVFFNYRVSKHLRIAPNVQYVFRNEHSDAFMLNCDFHVPYSIINRVEVYPIAGVCYASKNLHDIDLINDDVTSRVSHFGINLGCGVSIRCTSKLKLNIDYRYSLVKDCKTSIIAAGIGYCF